MDAKLFLEPLVQHGFVGLSGILLAIMVWLIRRLLGLLGETSKVIAENTSAIRSLDWRSAEMMDLTRGMRDRLIARPCIAGHEGR